MSGVFATVAAAGASDPYQVLSPADRALLKPQIERWIHDQTAHAWSDMWEIQDQTAALKNELLSGHKDANDMNRTQYVEAMDEVMGVEYPEIKAFSLTEVDKQVDGFQVVGCASEEREEWKRTRILYIHARIVDGKALFGLPDSDSEECKL